MKRHPDGSAVVHTYAIPAGPQDMWLVLNAIADSIRVADGNLVLLSINVSLGNDPDEWFVQAFFDEFDEEEDTTTAAAHMGAEDCGS